jgi:hypothetical protein
MASEYRASKRAERGINGLEGRKITHQTHKTHLSGTDWGSAQRLKSPNTRSLRIPRISLSQFCPAHFFLREIMWLN